MTLEEIAQNILNAIQAMRNDVVLAAGIVCFCLGVMVWKSLK
jgi:hypothetical protein